MIVFLSSLDDPARERLTYQDISLYAYLDDDLILVHTRLVADRFRQPLVSAQDVPGSATGAFRHASKLALVMAQQGRNGHHQDNGADTTSYIFNPMSYNYSQHHATSPLTVLSQQDATVMADFFNNPDTTSNDNAYMPYGVEGKPDFTNNITSDSTMTNHQVQQSHANFTSHSMPQASRIPVNIFDYSPSFLQNNHNQQASNNQSAGDAVAGASALLGLSSSQEQANLLGANSYMTWPNIVGAHLQAPMNNHNVNNSSQSNGSPMRNPPVKSHSTSQIQTQIQPPPTPATSWADIQAQEIAMRTRHPSLQLDTTSTHFPSHQQSWQNAPMSAAPHAGRRPPMMKFGSDNHFSPHGFTGPTNQQQEEKENTLLHMATAGDLATNASDAAQAQRTMTSLGHRHSITAGMPIIPTAHQSPVMVSGMGNSQLQNTFHTGHSTAGNNQSRKRTFSQVENSSTAQVGHDTTGQALPQTINGQRGASTSGHSNEPYRCTKRQNHIASEQKRRDTMKTNYEILGQRVPAVRDGGAMSRSEILHHVANHMEALIAGNQVMCGLAGITLAQLDELPDSEDEQSDGGED
ncbi:hypothetical protein AMS68_003290 [Peltaster fructicola]|uniref:BHLH domain-containing protein n=1 Tax=Peltaster fructicola TaxID=286661 RepID=A0A6H0XSS8_9PEZI|nr:hypothetical protein AMS68_003290 [Peltaster fructicola]